MNRCLSWGVFLVLVDVVRAEETVPPKPVRHVEQVIEGWKVQVDSRLLDGPDAELGKRVLRLLESRLADIRLVLPEDKLTRLQQVGIWLDRTHGALRSAQYHPSAEWLTEHGYDEGLTRCVHIPDAVEFASPGHQRVQPWSVMHELAHAYHHQVLDFDEPEITAAWKRFQGSGKYDKVLHINGHHTRHYALTNQKEFFAEMTESYLGTNDFYPFNRAELKEAEPDIFALLAKTWKKDP